FVSQDAAQSVRVRGARHHRGVAVLHGQSGADAYDVTRDIQRTTDLRERVSDAKTAIAEAEDSLDRYTQTGQGYDLSRHHSGRTTLRASLGAIRRRILSESSRGSLEHAEAAEELYSKAAHRAIGVRGPGNPPAA